MGSQEITLSAGVTALVPLDAPGGMIKLTLFAGTPAVVVATVDGSAPSLNQNVEVTGSQRWLTAVLGNQIVLQSPLYGDHMANATVRLLSGGSPTVLVEW